MVIVVSLGQIDSFEAFDWYKEVRLNGADCQTTRFYTCSCQDRVVLQAI